MLETAELSAKEAVLKKTSPERHGGRTSRQCWLWKIVTSLLPKTGMIIDQSLLHPHTTVNVAVVAGLLLVSSPLNAGSFTASFSNRIEKRILHPLRPCVGQSQVGTYQRRRRILKGGIFYFFS